MDKLKRFEELIRLTQSSLSEEDFIKAFSQVLKLVQDLKKTNEKEFALIHQAFKLLESKLKTDTSSTLAEMKAKVDELITSRFSKMFNDHKKEIDGYLDSELGYLEDKIDNLPSKEEIMTETLMQIPENKTEEVRSDMELLKESFDKKIEELKDMVVRSTQGRAFGGANANAVQYADLTAQCDGSTKEFQVPRHRLILGLQSTQFPIIYRPTTDFTTSNLILTLTDEVSAPQTGQTLIFTYIK